MGFKFSIFNPFSGIWNQMRMLRSDVNREVYDAVMDEHLNHPNVVANLPRPPRKRCGLNIGAAYQLTGNLYNPKFGVRKGDILIFRHEASDLVRGHDVYFFEIPGEQRWLHITGEGKFADPKNWVHLFNDATNMTSEDILLGRDPSLPEGLILQKPDAQQGAH